MDEFHSTKLARKKRTKWWGEHIVLAYVVVTGSLAVIFLGIHSIDKHLPGWLASLGVTPSGVYLILGTLWCAAGVWGIRMWKEIGFSWLVLNVWCLLTGIVMLGRAFTIL